MKRIAIISMLIFALLVAFAGCSRDDDTSSTTESTFPWENPSWNQTEPSSNYFNDESSTNPNTQFNEPVGDNNSNNNDNDYFNNQTTPTFAPETTTSNQNNNLTQNNGVSGNNGSGGSGNGIISDENMSKLENSNAVVYFSDNPNNKNIVTISQRYGVPKENLVALIKVNAEFPTVTVLEFSGDRDANGELIMTYEKFKSLYEINETTGKIVKASKNGMDNDGLSFIEAKVYIALAKEYFIPELPNLKANMRYD